ncbi:hypothetical protein E3O55_18975 [Cryobacterium sp. MDB1-18-2]|uniref:RHS repeat-associated core domain-containing protein n=1 Tax=unclassified Cryobacterium TaxID=2649013 RepID=UPI00106BA0F5|nr:MULTISPECIES: RHS repeat-associated core domain-containing protein [unclassified Cryobacterium]TFC22102.1 hypothetical protein E3O55_18975 [Cryobacterium sp. MDB1-18-2]TFC40675.1 hypothetical protein E3O50_12770 [Cryobacterium sp. MDB1-18-1]
MRNVQPIFNRFSRTVAVTAGAVALVLAASLGPVPAASAGDAGPAPFLGTPVPGVSAADAAGLSDASSSSSVSLPAAVTPVAGRYAVKVPAASSTAAGRFGDWQQLGTTPIDASAAAPYALVARPWAAGASGQQPASVEVLETAAARSAGLSDFALRLSNDKSSAYSEAVTVRIPSAVLSGTFGADYASRARWVQVPAGTPSDKVAATAVPAATSLDSSTGAVLVTARVSSAAVMLTTLAAPVSSTGTGSFAATSLKPSSAWDVSAQTGDFSWSLPLRTPPAAAGPAPSLALSYDSQSVDGETGSTNNQPSAVGEGWSLGGAGGFIERSYVSCAQDNGASGPVTTSGDLCWKTDNATISFAGHTGQLVRDTASGIWKLKNDDSSRFEHLVGTAQGCAANGTYDNDCWRLMTMDGTKYYFGLNQLPGWATGKPATNSAWTVPVFGNDAGEPCNAGSFATSSCAQAWRWNLDYVVDTHNNAEALYYDSEANNYSKNGTAATSYIRGGQLDHIDYGLTDGSAYSANAASDQVVLGYDAYGRCSDSTHATCTSEPITGAAVAPAQATAYPDVPFDQLCTSGACTGLLSPTFWTTGMLGTVTTRALTAGSYANVDVWTLGHSFPSPGDGTNAALWLTQVAHTGYSGGASLPEPTTTFAGTTLQNRVWVVDGLAPLDKYRISSITTAAGATISVNYSGQQCTTANAASIEAAPESNTARCFPQWWVPQVTPPQPAKKDLFHKYVVTSVVSNPRTGGGNDATQESDYVYTGTPAWRYDTSPLVPDTQRTWSVFAGYNTVEVRVGNPSTPAAQKTTDFTFYQGMDGDRATTAGGSKSVSVTGSAGVPDSAWFAGFTRETKTLNGAGGAVVTDTVNTPWASAVTATDGTSSARMTGDADALTTEPVSTGGNRTTDVQTTHEATYGLPVTVNTLTSDAGATCATTSYAPANTTAWIIGRTAEVAKVGVSCGSVASATYPAAAISDTRTTYDGLAWGATPTRGDATTTQIVDSYSGTTAATAHWATASQAAYDGFGRVTSATDVLGHTTTTAYVPAATAAAGSGALTSETVTNTAPFGWTSSTTYDPAWGVETSATDQNGKITTAAYDALGRRTAVWLPIRPQASNTTPSIGYAYTLSQSAATAVATTTLTAAGTVTNYTLYDGLGQVVQTQGPAEGSGTVVTDTGYDEAGRANLSNGAYWTTSVNPSAVQFIPLNPQQIGSRTVTTFDPTGRTLATILSSFGTERYRTSFAYPGADRTDTTPPAGGTPTSVFTNTLGQKTKLVQYLAATPASGTAETTTYGYTAQGKMSAMVDPAGHQWTWGFDVLGDQTTATDPDTGTTTSSYDTASNLLTSTDGRGTTLAYSYDALNRKTGQYLTSTGSTGSLLALWTYDTLAKGQLTSSSSYTGSTAGHPGIAYTGAVTGYDDSYLATGTTVSVPTGAPAFGGTSYATTYRYNQDGTPLTTTDPAEGGLASELLRYAYSVNGHLTSFGGKSSYLIGNVYSAIGQLVDYGRAATTSLDSTYGYDPANGAITEIKEGTTVSGTYTVVADRNYVHDNGGNVTSVTTTGTAATDTQCFSYDYLRDMTSAWTPSSNSCAAAPTSTTIGGPAPYWSTYAIDPATGNRTSSATNPTTGTGTATTDTYTYPAAGAARPHAVQSVAHTTGTTTTTSTYGYDASGNTTTRPAQTLTYDATGKLGTVTAGAVTQSNVYDASGSLLLQTDATTGSTLYLGDTELHVAPGSTTASAVRTYAPLGTPIAERTTVAGVSGSVATWVTTNIDGTADLEAAVTTGAVTRRYADPYGITRGTTATWSSSHGYLNAPTSSLSGLTQLGARAYDMALGKFLSVDTVLAPYNPQQNNGYAYSANSPVTFTDPSGNCYTVDDYVCSGSRSRSTAPSTSGTATSAAPAAGNGSGKRSGCVSVNPSSCQPHAAQPNRTAGGTVGKSLSVPANVPYSNFVRKTEAYLVYDAVMMPYNYCMAIGRCPLAMLPDEDIAALAPETIARATIRPEQIVGPDGIILPGVPSGVVGTLVRTGKGLEYKFPQGTPGLDARVSSVRIMDPVLSGRYTHVNGYAAYSNVKGQTVNPLTGRGVTPEDPFAHIDLGN